MGAFQVGDMPHAKVMRNIELFATKVLPYLPQREGAATSRLRRPERTTSLDGKM
jgi:hypothetical protein